MKSKLLIIALSICVIATPAMADMYGTAEVTYLGMVRGYDELSVYSPYGEGGYYDEDDVGLGLIGIKSIILSSPPDLPSDSYLDGTGEYLAFCIDLQDGFPTIIYQDYDVMALDQVPDVSSGGPMGSTKAGYIAQLLNTNTYTTADDAAAVQVAIWEIIYEPISSWNVYSSNGNFYLNTALGIGSDEYYIAGLATTILSGISQTAPFSAYTSVGSQPGKAYQDFVLVPTPVAVLLGVLGLGVAGIKLRKYA